MGNDIVFALRLLRRQPGLFGMAIGGLALAIGLSTAVFSFVYAVAFKDPGIRDAAAVFRLSRTEGPLTRLTGNSATYGNWAYSEFFEVRPAVTAMELSVAAVQYGRVRTDEVAAPRVNGRAVTGNYFALLGGSTVLGRTLAPSDDAPGAAPVVVLGYAFWKGALGGDEAILGTTMWIDEAPYTVVGVASRSFTGPGGPASPDPPAYWTALNAQQEGWARTHDAEAAARRARLDTLQGDVSPAAADQRASLLAELSLPLVSWNPAVEVVGRVRPGASEAQALSEVTTALSNFHAVIASGVKTSPVPIRLESGRYRNREEPALASIVLGIVGLVVLLAAANVTNVLLASAAGRAREIGTRLAIGASRGRVVRQLVTESVLLGSIGGALGFLIATWVTPVLSRLTPTFDLEPDPLVFAFVASLTLVIGVAAGLAPARYIRRGDLVSALKTDRAGGPGTIKPGRLRSTLVGVQAAASIVLLVLAALLTRSMVHASSIDLGYDPDRMLTASVSLGRSYTDARTRVYWDTALARLSQVPGIAGAALATPGPFSGQVGSRTDDGRYLHRVLASDGYFAAMGQRVIAGRTYTIDDIRSHANVAVITQSVAREFWGSKSPLGSSLEPVWGDDDPPGAKNRGLIAKPAGTRVIGVVSDTVLTLANVNRFCIYLPLTDEALRGANLVVRTTQAAVSSVSPVRDVLRSIDVDPSTSVNATVVRDEVDRDLLTPKMLALLTAIVGGTALLLAIIGLFGVTSFAVGQREHEVGIRLTLGATAPQILRMLIGDSLRPVAIGLSAGLVLALLLGRVVDRTLYGVSGHDPLAIAAAIAVLLGSAAAAVIIPARRAARVDPSQMLRES